MRILLVHNYYGSAAPSGENQVYRTEKALLVSRGHEVDELTRHSDRVRQQGVWGAVKAGFATPWNVFAYLQFRRMLDTFQPDVVHVHNTFPLISPAIFHAIGQRAASVLTLHNYRLLCPAAIPTRDGEVCTDCIDRRSVKPALRHSCYRASRLATLPLAANVALHRVVGTWQLKVDAFITLSDFQRNLMTAGGLPARRIHVKPNFYAGAPVVVPFAQRPNYLVFVGRLGEEKGLRALIQAWQDWGPGAPVLQIIGDGPLRTTLQHQAAGLPVEFLGQVSAETAQAHIARARLLLLPSECFEGFPMVIREAFAFGTPAAVSNLGPLPDIVQDGKSGLVFEAGNPGNLLDAVRSAFQAPGLLERLGQGARSEFEKKYTEEANYQALMHIYESAINTSRGH